MFSENGPQTEQILQEIGRGGMGVVYEAEQISLPRRVALKVLPFAAVLDPRQIERFKNEEPTPPRRIDPRVPRDLETIVLSALSKETTDRYQTAGEVAADLRRFQQRQPIVARRPSIVDRLAKWTRRHRAVVATTVVTLLAMEDPEHAAKHLREALELRRRILPGGRTPVEIQITWLFGRDLAADINHPGICAYAETQLKLGRVLRLLERPYEAECMLGDCRMAAEILCHEDLATDAERIRHRVLLANCYAELTELLVERRRDESQLALQLAAARWNEVHAEFPQAARFASGVRDGQNDSEWFENTFPEQNPTATELDLAQLERAIKGTMIEHHHRARAWSVGGHWKEALREFEESAALREHGGALDGLQIAMAHHHLGNHDEAQKWYAKAVTAMEEERHDELAKDLSEELETLREEASEVLASGG